jgi:tRNA nucleotidyltransferase (CCA-adding enzyme)
VTSDAASSGHGAGTGQTGPDPLEMAQTLARAVRDAGGQALVVGGWVRDRLLGRPAKDIDIEVFGIPADRLHALLERLGPVNTVGESFTVFKVADIDVSLPRRESKVGRGHRGFDVTGDPDLSVSDAARRRDFTINAIAWDPLTGETLDPFHGRADLAARVLRVVDPETFGDDSLRVLRAIQLAARFNLTLDAATEAICLAVPLDDLPAERVWGEIEKLLLQADRPSVGLEVAERLGVIARLFPECAVLIGCEQDPEWHPEGDAWVHTLMVVDQARARIDDLAKPQQVAIMLGAVAHDFGKPLTTVVTDDGHIRSPGHEEAGIEPAGRFLDRLNIHTMDGYDVRAQVIGFVANHLKPGMWHKSATPVGDGAFRRLAQKVDLELLARLAEADCRGRTGPFDCSAMSWFLGRARALGVEHRPPPPLLLGRHVLPLGVAPGPAVGRLLREVYERQLDGVVTSTDQAIALARELIERGARSSRTAEDSD